MLPASLPIHDLRQSLREAVAKPNARVVIEAPTGSGKSTGIPWFLLEENRPGKILVLQPRRIAARSLASYLARLRGEAPGQTVGWQIRFENQTSRATRLEFLTEGILLRRLLDAPTLPGVSAVILDEFHERNLFNDIAIARLKRLQEQSRPDLALVVMSATLQTQALERFLEPCTLLKTEGRTFPVEIRHRKVLPRRVGGIWDDAAIAAAEWAATDKDGDLLVFMPGRYEIIKTIAALKDAPWSRGFDLLALHGELNVEAQQQVLTPGQRRRVIVTTNVAETSLTIEGITAVIDSGLVRLARYDSRRGLDTLHVEKISRSSATQRAGRAGRVRPGLCLRLWDERDHAARPEATDPEIRRVDVSETILGLAAAGESPRQFPWFESPPPESLEQAITLLRELEALDSKEVATASGRRMAGLPLHPRLARMLLTAAAQGAAEKASVVAALLTGRPLFPKQKPANHSKTASDFGTRHDHSDFEPLLRAWSQARDARFGNDACTALGVSSAAAREIDQTASSLLRLLRAGPDDPDNEEAVWKALLAAYPDYVAIEISAGARVFAVAHGRRAKLSPQSLMAGAKLVVAAEIMEVSGRETTIQLQGITRIEEPWLEEIFPHAFSTGRETLWDDSQKRVIARESVRFLDLVIRSRESGDPDPDQAAEILAGKIIEGAVELPGWNETVEQWVRRVNFLSTVMPDLGLPRFSDEDKHLVLVEVCRGATNGRQLKDRSVFPSLKEWIGHGMAGLPDQYAPLHINLPNGKKMRLRYEEGGLVTGSAILQHLYDVTKTPAVAGGRHPVRVEILAPNQRPIQITGDLERFWKESYPAVKTQMRGRYPKHEWR